MKQKNLFSHYRATETLHALAKQPIDLTKDGVLTPERLEKYCSDAVGFELFYGTQRITDEVMQALEALAVESKAIQKMEGMQAGEVINEITGFPSDQRAVLHTAMRDFFERPNPARATKEAAALAFQECERLKAFIHRIERENRFDQLLSIAIGGSDLGPRAITLALDYLKRPGRKVHFVSNVDPDDVAGTLRQLDLKRTLVAVVSKSGTTLETVTNEEFVRSYYLKLGLDPNQHFIAITGKGSPMDNRKRYLECFYSWDYVGGRFSTSAVYGGMPLSFAYGFETYWEFLKGANAMDKAALERDLRHNLPLLVALLGIWNRNFLKLPTCALVPYSQALWRFSAHIQQVDMESNGKRIDKYGQEVDFETGPIIWGEPGTNAQHSFYQLIHQGTSIVPVELIGFRDSQYGEDIECQGTTSQEKLLANLFAQVIALAKGNPNANPNKVFPGNRPSHILLGKRLTPYAMGALFALYEHKVAFQGFIWGINSFDQEGVMLGKELANKMLKVFAGHEEPSFPFGPFFLKNLKKL